MRKHHTKIKGDLGVLKAQISLFEQGWLSLLPLTEHSDFDLVGYKDGEFKRIQCKYRKINNGKLEVRFCSTWSDKNGRHVTPVDKNEIDLYSIYCPETDECYWLNPNDFDKSVTLRLNPSKNNQKKSVNFLSDYLKIL